MSNLNLNATREEDTSLNSSLDVSQISSSSSQNTSPWHNAGRRGRGTQSQQERRKKQCNKIVFGSIIGMLIFVCLVNGIRSITESLPENSGNLSNNKSKCDFGENFMNVEPCWEDYTPKVEVAKMRDIYLEEEVGAGNHKTETLKLRDVQFKNPLIELLQDVELHKAFFFKGLKSSDNYLQDMYIMPIEEHDVEALEEVQSQVEAGEAIDEQDLQVPGFSRVIKYCNETASCKKSGIVEISEMYQESFENEYKRIINLEHDHQIFERQFPRCVVGDTRVKQKFIEMEDIGKLNIYKVHIEKISENEKTSKWITPKNKFKNFDCDQSETFEEAPEEKQ